MKNDYSIGDTRISIPPTLLVTAVGELEDSALAVTMDAKRCDDLVYLVGQTFNDMGKTQFFDMLGISGGSVPKLRNPEETIQTYRWLHRAMKGKLVASCHDLSDGGLAVAAAETAFSGQLGMTIDLCNIPGDISQDEVALFSETPGRLLVTISPAAKEAFEIVMGDAAVYIGKINEEARLLVNGMNGETIIDSDISTLKASWQKTLRFSEVSK